jgi:hypothetical protein
MFAVLDALAHNADGTFALEETILEDMLPGAGKPASATHLFSFLDTTNIGNTKSAGA